MILTPIVRPSSLPTGLCPRPRHAAVWLILAFALSAGIVLGVEGNLSFMASRLKISYQPRTRTESSGERSLRLEVAQLNLILNLINNYLLYLEKLGKIKLSAPLNLEYAPDGAEPSQSRGTRYVFTDLGLNAVLERVNEILAEQPDTVKRFLLSERADLLKIQDQHDKRKDPVEEVMGMSNVSDLLPSLAPESDFAVLGNGNFVTTRPTERLNELVHFTLDGSSSLLLPPGMHGYGHLLPSPDGTWLACTEDGEPRVIKVAGRQGRPLFADESPRQLLDWAWAPDANRLAGIVLDRQTLDRKIFIYDADQGKHSTLLENHPVVDGNYQFAFPIWTGDGKRLLFSTGTELHLVDLASGTVVPELVKTPHLIAEVIWHPNGRSFAWLEVRGQARNTTEFDSTDFPGSIIHRVFLDDQGRAIDDARQRHASSETIKLLGFYDLDRILFLEGKLHGQRVVSPLWKLEADFRARLTPPPGHPGANPAPDRTIGGVELPLSYLMVYRSLDSRFQNVYDAGLSSGNLLHVDRMTNTWFVGMRIPEGVQRFRETYCLRPSPYPFSERNRVVFLDLDRDRLMPIVDMLTSYNLRSFAFSRDLSMLALLSNSRGPLSLWCARLSDFAGLNLPQPVVSDSGSEDSLPAPSLAPSTLPAPLPPSSPASGPGLPSASPKPTLPEPTIPSFGSPSTSSLPAPTLPAPLPPGK